VRNSPGRYTTEQAARLVGRRRHQLIDLMRDGLLWPLPERFGNYYYWTNADIARLKKALKVRRGRGRPRKQSLPGKEAGHAAP
jgi:hypothetical protein